MTLESFIEYLNSVYTACNEHLLEQGRKRDQVIAFYIVLLSFVITYSRLISTNMLHSANLDVIYLGLVAIGLICIRTVADLRSWHQQYLDCIQIINWAVVHQNDYDSVSNLKVAIRQKVEAGEPKKFHLFGTTDKAVYTGVIIMTAVPVLFLGYTFTTAFWQVLLVVLIYLVVVLFWAANYLTKTINKGLTFNTWILNFDYDEKQTVLLDNKYMTITNDDNIPHVYQKTGGVVTVPRIDDKVVLLEIERNGSVSLEFPRGYKEASDDDYVSAAKRELTEELGIASSSFGPFRDLGKVEPDNGLITSEIFVVAVQINGDDDFELQSDEGISGYRIVSTKELNEMISRNLISDGFTLSAWAKETICREN